MIQFDHVFKTYRNSEEAVIKDVCMTLPSGQITVLIGPSGCGKTTCLKMINRLIKISSGTITIDGDDILSRDPIDLRRNMGYVIQQTGLFPHMTIRENIEIIPQLQRQEKTAITCRTSELMEMVGLDEAFLDRYPTQLSGGQLQRVGVARAFATDPEIILMDEPFSALDPITRTQLQDELISLQHQLNKTIVFVTHDMDEAIKIADQICILNRGVLVQSGTPEAIMKNPADDYVRQFVGRNRIWSRPEFIRARDIMLQDPLTAPKELSLYKTMDLMRGRSVNSVLVVDARHHFAGIVRAQDIRRQTDLNQPVGSLAVMPAVWATPDENILSLLAKVKQTQAALIPVIDDQQQLAGLITSSSLITTLSQQYINFEEAGLS